MEKLEELKKKLKNFSRRDTESLYISEYTKIYLEEKLKEKGLKKGLGIIIDEMVLNQEDFKEKFNNYLDDCML